MGQMIDSRQAMATSRLLSVAQESREYFPAQQHLAARLGKRTILLQRLRKQFAV